jgi:hypothetical protein
MFRLYTPRPDYPPFWLMQMVDARRQMEWTSRSAEYAANELYVPVPVNWVTGKTAHSIQMFGYDYSVLHGEKRTFAQASADFIAASPYANWFDGRNLSLFEKISELMQFVNPDDHDWARLNWVSEKMRLHFFEYLRTRLAFDAWAFPRHRLHDAIFHQSVEDDRNLMAGPRAALALMGRGVVQTQKALGELRKRDPDLNKMRYDAFRRAAERARIKREQRALAETPNPSPDPALRPH